jgi:hypothetical protein
MQSPPMMFHVSRARSVPSVRQPVASCFLKRTGSRIGREISHIGASLGLVDVALWFSFRAYLFTCLAIFGGLLAMTVRICYAIKEMGLLRTINEIVDECTSVLVRIGSVIGSELGPRHMFFMFTYGSHAFLLPLPSSSCTGTPSRIAIESVPPS